MRAIIADSKRRIATGERETVLQNPLEEYTQRLLAAAPVPNPIEQRRRREERHALLQSFGDQITELELDDGTIGTGPLDDSTRE